MRPAFIATISTLGVAVVFLSSASAALLMVPTGKSSEFAAITDESTAIDHASVQAAFATTNEAGMDNVYGEQNFSAGTFIDISFNPIQNELGVLGVESQADLLAVFALGTNPSPTVNMIFIDTIDWCGFFSTGIVGCARGNTVALESEAAASSMGIELNAHELGHILDLRHTGGAPNLMTGPLNGDTTLTLSQVAIVNNSPLVQGSNPNRFISITPIVVQRVPEPSAVACLSLAGLLFISRRQR